MTPRTYSLFRKEGKRWVRVPGKGAYLKADAIRIFQNSLLAGGTSLRPVVAEASVVPAEHQLCGPCAAHTHNCTNVNCNCACAQFRR